MKLSEKLISAAIGAAVGVGSTWLAPQGKSRHGIVMAGVVGGSLGYGGALAWGSRGRATAFARTAVQRVNEKRDARWLDKHPIAYA
jgi:hypothetical protein